MQFFAPTDSRPAVTHWMVTIAGLARLCTIVGLLAVDAFYVSPGCSIAWADQPSCAQAPLQGSLVELYKPTDVPDVNFHDKANIGSGSFALVGGSDPNPRQSGVVATGAEELPGGTTGSSQAPADPTGQTQWTVNEQLEQFEQRIKELETGRLAQESATRDIIRQSFAEKSSNITDMVQFGGTLETLTFWQNDFDGVSESDIVLDTAELDFVIQVNPWAQGVLFLQYDNGQDVLFPTAAEDPGVPVDRINVRDAYITIGDTSNYPLFATFGRTFVPFGISTGDPVADVLTIVDPLTVEVFETREDVIMFGFEAPTCCPPPTSSNPVPPPVAVRPMLISPLVRHITTSVCRYCPCVPPAKPAPLVASPLTCQSPYVGAIYFYNGNTIDGPLSEDHIQQMGGTLGYRKRGMYPYYRTPWSFEAHADVNSSVFDSEFLQFEYRHFLDQIGFVPGMAAYIRSSYGPVALVTEWNGAINDATFDDDLGDPVTIRPEAWQVTLGYQFDWNPTVEVIGAQGTYFTIGYSESQGLAGVTRVLASDPTPFRVGNVPEKRLSVGIGEWVVPGLRVAFEYSHAVDYSVGPFATGNSADAFLSQMTLEW